ncbi:hypothetical protein M1116_02280 [Patescibacteria group bacterium]|nr:hypothetical protein [Patescibacteria group bacterium]
MSKRNKSGNSRVFQPQSSQRQSSKYPVNSQAKSTGVRFGYALVNGNEKLLDEMTYNSVAEGASGAGAKSTNISRFKNSGSTRLGPVMPINGLHSGKNDETTIAAFFTDDNNNLTGVATIQVMGRDRIHNWTFCSSK